MLRRAGVKALQGLEAARQVGQVRKMELVGQLDRVGTVRMIGGGRGPRVEISPFLFLLPLFQASRLSSLESFRFMSSQTPEFASTSEEARYEQFALVYHRFSLLPGPVPVLQSPVNMVI